MATLSVLVIPAGDERQCWCMVCIGKEKKYKRNTAVFSCPYLYSLSSLPESRNILGQAEQWKIGECGYVNVSVDYGLSSPGSVWCEACGETSCWIHTSLLFLQVFHDIAYKAKDRQDLIAGIDEFLDEVIVLPPGEWDPAIRIEPPKSLPSSDKRWEYQAVESFHPWEGGYVWKRNRFRPLPKCFQVSIELESFSQMNDTCALVWQSVTLQNECYMLWYYSVITDAKIFILDYTAEILWG